MKLSLPGEFGERLFTWAAVALAIVSGGFGGLMVVRLERMENPPLMMGLDFSSLQEDADPLVTGTISPRPVIESQVSRLPEQTRDAANLDFRLLSVVDGVAFVEVEGPGGKELWPVDIGATLPGAGQVISIERDARRWRLRTTLMTITGEAQ